jgi:hypothetical protein
VTGQDSMFGGVTAVKRTREVETKRKVLGPDLESIYGSLARGARVILGLDGSVS